MILRFSSNFDTYVVLILPFRVPQNVPKNTFRNWDMLGLQQFDETRFVLFLATELKSSRQMSSVRQALADPPKRIEIVVVVTTMIQHY